MIIKALFFDLDDTLHNFSESAEAAMSKVYSLLGERYQIDKERLIESYRAILAQAVKHAFLDGRSSQEYRTERFSILLNKFGIKNSSLVDELIKIYSTHIELNTKLYEDALNVLITLKNRFDLYLVTEGPSDAQRKAIRILKLEGLFTDVFISGEARKIKETGELFKYTLHKTGYLSSEVVIIGDSYERDIIGGLTAGITTIWFNKKRRLLSSDQKAPNAEIYKLFELENALNQLLLKN